MWEGEEKLEDSALPVKIPGILACRIHIPFLKRLSGRYRPRSDVGGALHQLAETIAANSWQIKPHEESLGASHLLKVIIDTLASCGGRENLFSLEESVTITVACCMFEYSCACESLQVQPGCL